MNAESLAKWTLDDVKAYCQRFGLTLSEPQLLRMHELSATVSATGMGIPRMPVKDSEPALTFSMPKE